MTERVQTFAEQAIERMLKEMNNGHDELTDQIHNWLCEKPQVEDDELMEGVVKDKKKTLASCCVYVRDQAKKQARNGFAAIRDDVVFGWVRDFFTKDEIKVEKIVEAKPSSKPIEKEPAPKKSQEQLKAEREEAEQEQQKQKEIAKAEKQFQKEKQKAKENGFMDIFEFIEDPFEDFPKVEQTHDEQEEVEDDEENCDDD